jgi:L-amino acid N-acyltransferase YncA
VLPSGLGQDRLVTVDQLRIRRLDPDSDAEINTSVAFGILTIYETLSDARRDPTIVPNFSFEAMKADYSAKSRLDSRRFLVAEDADGGIVGHSIFKTMRDEAGVLFGYCATRYVLPGWRRRGLGGRFLDDALTWFRAEGVAYVLAHTHQTNAALRALFEGRGFTASPNDGRWPTWELRLALTEE